MGRNGWAPAALGRLNVAGSPMPALLVSSYGIVVALALEKWAPRNAFEYILRGAFFGMMLSWLVSLAAHVRFRRHVPAEELASIPVHSPLKGWGSMLGFALVSVIVLKGWWDSRVNLISALAYLVILTVAYWMIGRIQQSRIGGQE